MQKIVSLMLVLLLLVPFASAVTGKFTVSTGMKFTGTSSDPGTYYQDGVGGSYGNPDIGIELCDAGSRYVGAVNAINIGGTWQYFLVSYSSSTNALALTTEDQGNGCYQAQPGYITISPSKLSTPSPEVYRASLPSNLYIGYDTSANPGGISDFVYSQGSAKLLGDYSVGRSYVQSTNKITISTPQITFTSTSGSFSKSASDSTFGINSERRLALGICDDDHGEGCVDGGILTSPTFPTSLNTGLSTSLVNDQHTYTKYVVLNGIGKSMCIGANLRSVVSVNPDPIYYSQMLNISIILSNPRNTPYEINGGNVDITSPFDVDVKIYEQGNPSNQVYSTSFSVTGNILAGGSYPVSITWPANAHSGTYVVSVTADVNNDLTECVESDNDATTTFELKPVTIPEVFIDGVETSNFNNPNVPYKVNIHMKNSDNDILSNATVIITEENGLTLTIPTQIYNRTIDSSNNSVRDGIRTKTEAMMKTDNSGNLSFTFIPTHNPLYDPDYNYLHLDSYIGDYALYMKGNQSDGSQFKFIKNQVLYSEYNFEIINNTYNGTLSTKTLEHQTFVTQMMDFVYHLYNNFLETIV